MYNFKSGDLNMPVNIGFVPGRKKTQDIEAQYQWEETYIDPVYDNDGNLISGGYWDSNQILISEAYTQDYHTGNRFSITVGFNMSK